MKISFTIVFFSPEWQGKENVDGTQGKSIFPVAPKGTRFFSGTHKGFALR
jgi:hypothetical protein